MNPKLSIVVPTKNRYEYLEVFVDSFVEFNSPHFELVILDNSDVQNMEFHKKLISLNDPRVKYNYQGGWLSVVENCDRGVSMANGTFVCMLGDDDGVVFSLIDEVLTAADDLECDAVLFNKAEYYWPDTSHAVWKDALAGKLFCKSYSGSINFLDGMEEAKQVFNEGAAWSLRGMPRVYHGFVRKTTLDMLFKITGSYFPGPSPDMSNAVGLALLVGKYIEIDLPVVISGHSKKSTGGMGGEKLHHGKIEDQPHLPLNTAELWSYLIPKFWSGATIYAESARLAAKRTGAKLTLNYAYLWAFCLVFESQHRRSTFNVVLRYPHKWLLVIYYATSIFVFRGWNFIKNYLFFARNETSSVIAAVNIREAHKALQALNLKIRRG